MVATGYTSFNKKCILYGSSGNVKVFVSNVSAEALDCPEAPQYTNPSAKVQAVDPVVLSMDVVCSCDCRVPCLTSMPKSITSTLDNSTLPERPAKAVLVTLGLFSIIQMERDVQMPIPAYDYCIPERECNCNTANPCETFAGIDFPVDEFFPRDKEDCCPCCPDSGNTGTHTADNRNNR
ncbi:MAG: hypothetical protein BHV98_00035 [Clostridium sp. CAG:217_53_7]|nr:MAG: hypothetical protein BHV98_00035 [Clostridium sp. CAG:217_53_7]